MEENKSQLMEVMSEHVYHPRLADHYGEIYESLSDEAARSLNKLLWKLYRREIRVYDFEKQAVELKVPKFQEDVWPGILRYDLMPIADYLGFHIQDYLHHFRPADFKNFKVIDLEDWITKLNTGKRLGLNTVDQKKVFNILSQYLRGLKSSSEVAELISHPVNLGGIGLNPEFAKETVDSFKNSLGEALANDQIITEQKIDPQIIEKLKNKKEEEVFFKSHTEGIKPSSFDTRYKIQDTSSKPVASLSAQEAKRESLAATAVAKINEPFRPAIETYDAEAEKMIRQVNIKLAPELEKRLKVLVISRLKDIRKLSELREKLLSLPAENGIGLKIEEAEKIIKLAEEGRTKLMSVASTVIPSRVEGSLSQKQEIPPLSGPAGGVVNRNDIKKVSLPLPAPVVPPKPAKTPPHGGLGGVQAPRPATIQMEDNFAPRTSADIKKSIPQAIKIVPQLDSRPKIELAPPPPPKPPQTVAIPQTPNGKAKLEDVAYRPRLMGPLEELKEMSLLDFRRLSPKVKVSIDKISAKIELLGQESYENKIRGIQAWQGSPVNSLYKAILNESLRKSLTVNQVIEEKQKRNEETLKPEEFRAVVELNRSFKV